MLVVLSAERRPDSLFEAGNRVPYMSDHVFLCYAREDEKFVLKLARNLKDRGVPLWVDQWEIRRGDWDRAIDAALADCAYFLIVLSPTSVERTEVRGELRYALNRQKPIVPLLYQDCEIPRQLLTEQYVDFRTRGPDDEDALDQVMHALGVAEPPVAGRVSRVLRRVSGSLTRELTARWRRIGRARARLPNWLGARTIRAAKLGGAAAVVSIAAITVIQIQRFRFGPVPGALGEITLDTGSTPADPLDRGVPAEIPIVERSNEDAVRSAAPVPRVVSVEVTPPEVRLMVRETLSLTATPTDATGAEVTGGAVSWSSTDSAVAQVSPSGMVTGVAPGTATIAAISEGGTGAATVVVAAALPPVSAGFWSSCWVTSQAAAYCWGGNAHGELGDSSTTDRRVARPVHGGRAFASVSAGGAVLGDPSHACGVTRQGAAYCWGSNTDGELGSATTEICRFSTPCSTTPAPVAGGLTFVSVSAGYQHTCGVTTDGAAYCWGANDDGRLGDGSTTDRRTPVLVAGGFKFVSVSAGYKHTCGVTTDGAGYCWGANDVARLGDGSTADRSTPARVFGELKLAWMSAGYSHTCSVTTDGDAFCWGTNGYGELGSAAAETCQADAPCRTTPVRVGELKFTSVSAGYYHSCGVTKERAAYCWGASEYGEIGSATTGACQSATPCSTTPVPVVGGFRFTSVSAGYLHTCGVADDGLAYCWGRNDHGQLGDGSTNRSSKPIPVAVSGDPQA